MLDENEQLHVNLAGLEAGSNRNRGRGFLTLALLVLVALVLVAVTYRQFWLESPSFQGATDQTTSEKVNEARHNVNSSALRKRSRGGKRHTPSASEAPTAMAESSVSDIAWAPFRVDVMYPGGRHEILVARDSAFRLDLEPDLGKSVAASSADAEGVIVNAAERDSIPSMEPVGRPAKPIYPLLAQRMKVEGSVVLQARIGKDGSVQSVQVVSGPDILARAAMEAVSQWRFKPSYKAGRPVPADTRVTVNFTISTR